MMDEPIQERLTNLEKRLERIERKLDRPSKAESGIGCFGVVLFGWVLMLLYQILDLLKG
ncbi:MAG: hypothetical protein H6830_12585 [Planctomycetes bacterium]|nr:hypothetical protein [Planctomycetota bacterium]HPF13037.1 hypothetical protein [Planctomycetota bacterium]HRV81394.1 hypothetical protein [Planctomycetota bacterium]